AAGTTGRARGVPRVVRGAVGLRLGGWQQAELRSVRLAHDHAPGGAQPGEQVRVVVGREAEVAEEPVPEVQGLAREGAVEVLHQDRYAAEGPVDRVLRLRPGAFVAPV